MEQVSTCDVTPGMCWAWLRPPVRQPQTGKKRQGRILKPRELRDAWKSREACYLGTCVGSTCEMCHAPNASAFRVELHRNLTALVTNELRLEVAEMRADAARSASETQKAHAQDRKEELEHFRSIHELITNPKYAHSLVIRIKPVTGFGFVAHSCGYGSGPHSTDIFAVCDPQAYIECAASLEFILENDYHKFYAYEYVPIEPGAFLQVKEERVKTGDQIKRPRVWREFGLLVKPQHPVEFKQRVYPSDQPCSSMAEKPLLAAIKQQTETVISLPTSNILAMYAEESDLRHGQKTFQNSGWLSTLRTDPTSGIVKSQSRSYDQVSRHQLSYKYELLVKESYLRYRQPAVVRDVLATCTALIPPIAHVIVQFI